MYIVKQIHLLANIQGLACRRHASGMGGFRSPGKCLGPIFVWDGIPWSFVAAPTLKNRNGTTCVLLGMRMGREVGMFCNDGTEWESTKIEMGWDGTVVS